MTVCDKCGKVIYSIYFLKIEDPCAVEDKEYELCRECANGINNKISKNRIQIEAFLKQTLNEDLAIKEEADVK